MHHSTSGHFPDPRGAVAAGGGEVAAIGAENDIIDVPIVLEAKRLFLRSNVPQPRRAIAARGGDPEPIGGEVRAIDCAPVAQRCGERADLEKRLIIPP